MCAHVGVSELQPLLHSPGQGPPATVSSSVCCSWAAAGGGGLEGAELAGRSWPGPSSWRALRAGGDGGGYRRSPLPQPAQGWKPPSAGLVHGGVTTTGQAGGALVKAKLHRPKLMPRLSS